MDAALPPAAPVAAVIREETGPDTTAPGVESKLTNGQAEGKPSIDELPVALAEKPAPGAARRFRLRGRSSDEAKRQKDGKAKGCVCM